MHNQVLARTIRFLAIWRARGGMHLGRNRRLDKVWLRALYACCLGAIKPAFS